MVRRKIEAQGHENLERWLLTYADMITLLTAFFLMMYSMSVMSKGKFSVIANSVRSGFGVLDGGAAPVSEGGQQKPRRAATAEEKYRQYQSAMRDLSRFVEQTKLSGKVNVRSDERGVIISLLADKMLFARGQALLAPQSKPMLAKVAQVIATVPNGIQIEGHTDDVPIQTAQFPSNWELSSARAAAVLREFTGRYGLPGRRFIAAGYADTRPLVPNDVEADRARNRRVDIVILKTEAQHEAELLRKTEIRRVTAGQEEQSNVSESGR